MSAKPENLCYLAKGKALGAFDGFVDTWNWIVSFIANLKGEGDDYDATGDDKLKGKVSVDRSVDDHPVIRGGGGGGEIAYDLPLEDVPVLDRWQRCIITKIRYDIATHSIQAKYRYMTTKAEGDKSYLTGLTVENEEWITIENGTADPLYVGE